MTVIWSATRLGIANHCLTQYWYHYGNLKLDLPPTAPMAFGTFLHRKLETFYKQDPAFQPRKGERFHAPTSEPRNKSAAAFAGRCRGDWKRFVRDDLEKHRTVRWENPEEPYWYLGAINEICPPLYERYAAAPPPLFAEYAFEKVPIRHHDHTHWFRGDIDEIRHADGKIVLRDHKTGKEQVSQYELAFDVQFTIYGLAFLHEASTNERTARRCGINPAESRHWNGEETSLLTTLLMERHEVRTGTLRRTQRTVLHAEELLTRLDYLEALIEREEYPPRRGHHCNRCPLQIRCAEDFTAAQAGTTTREVQPLLFYEYANPCQNTPAGRTVRHRLFTKTVDRKVN